MRIKALFCLYSISRLQSDPGARLSEILNGVVGLIPYAFQFPELIMCRIKVDEGEYKSNNFSLTPYMLSRELIVEGKKSGVIEICYGEKIKEHSSEPFLWEEITFLKVLTERLSETIERKRNELRVQKARKLEIDIGGRIQKSLLFSAPPDNLEKIRISAMSIPSVKIDGDFYEFFTHSESCFDVMIGDVMGKGVPAALAGAGTKTVYLKTMGELLSRDSHPPPIEKIIEALHNRIINSLMEVDTFITLCYLRFDIEKGLIHLIDCGHTKGIHISSLSGEESYIKGNNLPIGFVEKEQYVPKCFPIYPGDIIFLYSDGVIETRGKDIEFFGEKRLMRFISQNKTLSPQDMVKKLQQELILFKGDQAFPDDLTCIAIKIEDQDIVLKKEIHLSNNISELKDLREFIQNIATSAGLDNITSYELATATNESAANIIKHAFKFQKQGSIIVRTVAYDDRVFIELLHRGSPFNPTWEIPDIPDFNSNDRFGLIIMKKSVDYVQHLSLDKGYNMIRLIKKIKKENKNGA